MPRFSDHWNDRVDSSARLLELGSAQFGIAPVRFEITYNSFEARSHYIGVRSANAEEILGNPVNHSNGGGAFDRTQALISGIAETVERYSAAYVPENALVSSSYDELPGPGLHPADFALFAAHQYEQEGFPYVPFTDSTTTSWTVGLNLRTGQPTYVPAQVVYLNRHIDRGARIAYATSNGLACGPDYSEAAVSALLECAERDAVMITWNAGLAMPHIDLESDPRVKALVDRHFRPTGVNFGALDLTAINGVPTSLAVVWSHDTDNQLLSVGAASRATLADACVEALLEAFHCTAYCRSLIRDEGVIASSADVSSSILTLEDHVRFYGTADHIAKAWFLLGSSERTDLSRAPALPSETPSELLASIVDTLDSDIDCALVDVTSPDIRDSGLSIVKAVCPQLIPLGVGWRDRYIGGTRLLTVPHRLGLAPQPLTHADLTPYPHPFP